MSEKKEMHWYDKLRAKCAELFELVHELTDESKTGEDISELVASVSPFTISTVEEKYKIVTDEELKDAKGKPILTKKGLPTFKELFFDFTTLPLIPKDNKDTARKQLEFVDLLCWLIAYGFEVDEESACDVTIDTLRRKNTTTETEKGKPDVIAWSGVNYSHVIANCIVPNLRTRISLAEKRIVTPKPKSVAELAADKVIRAQIVKAQAREDTFSAAIRLTHEAMLSMPEGVAAWLRLCDDSPEHARYQSKLVRDAEKDAQDAQDAQDAEAIEEVEVTS